MAEKKESAPKKTTSSEKKAPAKTEKKPIEREVIKVSEPKAETKAASSAKIVERPKGNPTPLRIFAFVFWLIGIGFEVLAILMLNKTMYVPSDKFTLYLVGALVIDLIAVIVGSQLWKKANHIDPASEKNKAAFFLQNQLGVIMAVIAFVPVIIILLKNKDLDAKTKKIVTAVAAVALVIASLFSIDFNPVSQEQVKSLEEEAAASGEYTGTCYWTQFGKSYHFDQNCQTLTRSKTLYSGTLEDAIAAGRTDACDFCAGGGNQK